MTLSAAQLAALLTAMLVLAAVPSLSALTVAARALAGGMRHGIAATAGVVVGDLVWIAIALGGHRWLRTQIDGRWLSAFGGVYLLVMAMMLARVAWAAPSPVASGALAPSRSPSLPASALAGLLLTLGDQKAVLFYLGFLPAFIGDAPLRATDVAAIAVVAALGVGLPKLVYAALAARFGGRFSQQTGRRLNALAAVLVALAGLWLISTALGLDL